jgi:hypothetical protein
MPCDFEMDRANMPLLRRVFPTAYTAEGFSRGDFGGPLTRVEYSKFFRVIAIPHHRAWITQQLETGVSRAR